MNKKFRDLDEMSSYIVKEMLDKDNISCIVPIDILDDIYYPLQEQLNLISCYRETSSDYDSYVITKRMVSKNRFVLFTEPLLYNEDLELSNDISNDWIIVVEGCIDGEDIELLDEKEGIEFVDLEDYCEECESCHGGFDKETTIQELESEYDQLGSEDKEYIDLLVDEILDNILCPDCLREQLAEVFNEGFKAGKNTILLAVSDSLRNLID